MTSKRRMIFIPCYNCENQILRVLKKLEGLDLSKSDILIVENKSTDATLRKVLVQQKERNFFKVVSHNDNYGLGGSFKTALKYSKENNYEYLYVLHGDDQAEVEDLKRMIEVENKYSVDCIFGARFMKDSVLHNYSRIRIIGNKIFNFIFATVFSTKVYDIGSGLNCYRIESLPNNIERWPSHIAFDVNLLIHYLSGRYTLHWLPIKWNEVDQVSNARNISVGIMVLKILFNYTFKKKLFEESATINRGYVLHE